MTVTSDVIVNGLKAFKKIYYVVKSSIKYFKNTA